jgi:hypothetical protein
MSSIGLVCPSIRFYWVVRSLGVFLHPFWTNPKSRNKFFYNCLMTIGTDAIQSAQACFHNIVLLQLASNRLSL